MFLLVNPGCMMLTQFREVFPVYSSAIRTSEVVAVFHNNFLPSRMSRCKLFSPSPLLSPLNSLPTLCVHKCAFIFCVYVSLYIHLWKFC